MRTPQQLIGLSALLMLAMALSTGRAAESPKPGHLIVIDNGHLFSEEGIRQAKERFTKMEAQYGGQATLETIAELPESDAKKLASIEPKKSSAERGFWRDFARSKATSDKAHGVYILISVKPGHVEVLADKEIRRKGFDEDKEEDLADGVAGVMRVSLKEKTASGQSQDHDKALLWAVDYMIAHLPHQSGDVQRNREHAGGGESVVPGNSGGWGIGGWVCIGLAVVAVIWLVFALIRGFSGGGMMGGGMGGGGYGGGGFLSSMLGGMFGSVAGMWMYNQFFGGGSSWGRDYGNTGNYGDTGMTDTGGTGDFSGDQGAGGSFDNGGDTGGGGDFGGDGNGGGSDFGGGGGDF